jgi:hypothetical protein
MTNMETITKSSSLSLTPSQLKQLPPNIQFDLDQLEIELNEGDITQKGFDKKRNKLLAPFWDKFKDQQTDDTNDNEITKNIKLPLKKNGTIIIHRHKSTDSSTNSNTSSNTFNKNGTFDLPKSKTKDKLRIQKRKKGDIIITSNRNHRNNSDIRQEQVKNVLSNCEKKSGAFLSSKRSTTCYLTSKIDDSSSEIDPFPIATSIESIYKINRNIESESDEDGISNRNEENVNLELDLDLNLNDEEFVDKSINDPILNSNDIQIEINPSSISSKTITKSISVDKQSNDDLKQQNFHVNEYYYHIQQLQLEQQQPSLDQQSNEQNDDNNKIIHSTNDTTTATTSNDKLQTQTDILTRHNYIPHQKGDRVVKIVNKSDAINSKKSKKSGKGLKDTDDKYLKPILTATTTTTTSTTVVETAAKNHAPSVTDSSTSASADTMNDFKQPTSRVSAKIQQLLNTLKRPKRRPLNEYFEDNQEEVDCKLKFFFIF